MTDANPILIIGASCRAAAWSARQAGYQPITIDLFRDSDTVDLAEQAIRVTSLSDAIKTAESLPNMPWFYTGGFEHHPELIDQLAKRMPLLGCSGDTVRRVRNPILMHEMFQGAGFTFAESRLRLTPRNYAHEWLRKPLQSGGGRHIRFALQSDIDTLDSHYYYQRHYHSSSYSAAYISDSHQCLLIGVSQQLIGPQPEIGCDAPPFRYLGNIGPISLPCQPTLQAIGRWLTRETGIKGIWGLDFGLNDGSPVIFEINPRYTASVEIYERSLGGSSFHIESMIQHKHCTHRYAKFVVYAAKDFEFRDRTQSNYTDAIFADIPYTNEICRANQPVLSIIVKSQNHDVLNVLRDVYQDLKWLYPIH